MGVSTVWRARLLSACGEMSAANIWLTWSIHQPDAHVVRYGVSSSPLPASALPSFQSRAKRISTCEVARGEGEERGRRGGEERW